MSAVPDRSGTRIGGTSRDSGDSISAEFKPCPRCGSVHNEDYCSVCEEFGANPLNEPHPDAREAT